ncbi:MAG: phenylalanine--tRNA ligase subunit beta [Porphyromonadaceae bacterium]|nr:phenylalanine--tRNA ligase subunit beta [Porphyromonadaceae bacterium]
MNISYQWLREYLPTSLTPSEVATALTAIGLETGGIEEVDSLPGGLRGLVIGEVLTCRKHENSDHLSVTTVSIGEGEPLQIVCGAPNVCAGKAVVVATIGTVLGSGQEQFTIKKSKIRGEESYGMLCSEVEIGVGANNDGIILIDLSEVRVGMPAAEYFGVVTDAVLEVDITPNRVDATSHYGVARDLAAYLTQHAQPIVAKLPEVALSPSGSCPISVEVQVGQELVPRFQGLVIRGLEVAPSPEWLRFRLEAIGQKPINNVVDVTNYVLHEYGQPLHAYDLDKVGGDKLTVGLATEGCKMTMLDHTERTLSNQDLVISDAHGTPLCVGGVMGGEGSGTTEATKAIFLEAAGFNASSVRRTARRLGLSTDSSFRFERGLDPERTEWALLRAAALILELCPGAYIDGGISDHHPTPQPPYTVELSLARLDRLVGQSIPRAEVERILRSLEIEIKAKGEDLWTLAVPRYRVDVTREVDVIEEIMRIYGYNSVELSGYIHANLSTQTEVDRSWERRLLISEQLVGAGFSEILCNSLSSAADYEGLSSYPSDGLVRLVNPLSAELGVMRQTLLFGGLQSIGRNLRRQQHSFYFFEWGNCYRYEAEGELTMSRYKEDLRLGLWIAGERVQNSWAHSAEKTSPFELKAHLEHILVRLGLKLQSLKMETVDYNIYSGKALEVRTGGGKLLARLGQVCPKITAREDINLPVYYAELEWGQVQREAERAKIVITDLPKYPVVKRDLSLLLDIATPMSEVERVARSNERKYLRRCELFDVYEGKNLPAGKKSYAVSFFLQDEDKTMSDKQIDAIMEKIQKNLEKELGASLR